MARHRHLKNAPITEALIDFRVQLSTDFVAQDLSSLKEEFVEEYPEQREQRQYESRFQIEHSGEHSQSYKDKGVRGYFLVSNDKKQVVQFRDDGFTFSRLRPYTEWKIIVKEAKALWNSYARVAMPVSISRLAVRYINHLSLPQSTDVFRRYLKTPPLIPDNVPTNLSSFLTRVVVNDPDSGLSANITQALEESEKSNYLSIILDIDAYKNTEPDIEDEEIWETFEELHNLKNDIFFNTITEDAVRLFE